MEKLERILWLVIISIIVFCLIPSFAFLMSDFWANIYANICVFLVNIFYCILLGVELTRKKVFRWYYSIIVGIVFIMTAILIYNFSAIYYSLLYILLILVSSLIYKKKKV